MEWDEERLSHNLGGSLPHSVELPTERGYSVAAKLAAGSQVPGAEEESPSTALARPQS